MDAARLHRSGGLERDYRSNTAIAFAAIGAFVFGGSELAPHLATMRVADANPNLDRKSTRLNSSH